MHGLPEKVIIFLDRLITRCDHQGIPMLLASEAKLTLTVVHVVQ